MTRLAPPLLALALGVAAALALVACGSGSDAQLLPGNTAQEITENLDSVQQLADEGECVSAQDEALQVSTQVEALEGIDAKLKQNLEEGATRLNEVVATCTEETTVESVEEPESTSTETTTSKAEEKEREKEAKEAEKEAEKEAKEAEKEAKAEQPEGPTLPPQAEGKAKGHEEIPGSPEEGTSGGIGPGSEVEGESEGEG